MFGLPSDASLHGHEVDSALRYLAIATGVCFVVMVGVLAFAVARHREAKRRAHYSHGQDRWNFLWAGTTAMLVFVAVDLVSLGRSLRHLREGFWAFPEESGSQPFRVEVTAQQWSWTFRYPGADGRFETGDDILSLDELRVPVGRPVLLQLRAKDVVHSFYLPNFRTKVDAIPGHITRLWFVPREEGTFEIACSQHCGVGHYRMRGELQVMQPRGWEAWANQAAKETGARQESGVPAHADGWAWEPRP
jgi:cytochrome c oxidase subunit 2